MANYSFESVEYLRDIRRVREALDEIAPDSMYVIEVGFAALDDEKERKDFSSMPTTLSLGCDKVERLKAVGSRLLRDQPEYQKLLENLRTASVHDTGK